MLRYVNILRLMLLMKHFARLPKLKLTLGGIDEEDGDSDISLETFVRRMYQLLCISCRRLSNGFQRFWMILATTVSNGVSMGSQRFSHVFQPLPAFLNVFRKRLTVFWPTVVR